MWLHMKHFACSEELDFSRRSSVSVCILFQTWFCLASFNSCMYHSKAEVILALLLPLFGRKLLCSGQLSKSLAEDFCVVRPEIRSDFIMKYPVYWIVKVSTDIIMLRILGCFFFYVFFSSYNYKFEIVGKI